jgi:hypothetical protein
MHVMFLRKSLGHVDFIKKKKCQPMKRNLFK